jgi:outer membrane usher protein
MVKVSYRAFRLAEALLMIAGLRAETALADTPRIASEPVATWVSDADILTSAPERLFLAVRLNAQDRGVFEFVRTGQSLSASADTLRRIGLALPRENDPAKQALDGIAGLKTQLDESLQELDLAAPPSLLAAPPVAVNQLQYPVITSGSTTGLVVNYDLYSGADPGSADASGLLALRAFAGRTVLETTGIADWRRIGRQENVRAIRLDTSLSHVWPEQGLRMTFGDFITGSLAWSRPTRLGGIQVGTDFALQPYMPTAPMPAFMGTAALPSQVELFIDGVKRWDGEVSPGRFSVGAGPGRTDGQGKAQLVLTDILGRVSTQEFTFYETPSLLRKGLTQWSVAAGTVRLEYGDASFAYADEPVLSGSWRRGMTDRLTFEAHGEVAPNMAVGGIGVTWLMGPMGVISGSLALGTGRSTGQQWTLGYSLRSGNFYLSAELRRASAGFGDIASRWGPGPALAIDNLQFGYSRRQLGALSLGYLRLRQADDMRWRFATLNWSRPLTRQLTITANLRQNLDQRTDRAAFVSIGFTPGANRHASLGMQSQNGARSYTGSFQQNAPLEGGLGWRADLIGAPDRWQGQAQVNWLGDHGEAQARAAFFPGGQSFHAGLSGSLALMEGAVFASRRIDDGFALVTTGEAAGVPVLVHNRQVGKSGKDGRLLVTQLRAFEENAIAIDPTALSEDYSVGTVNAKAIPSDRSGVRITFPVRKVHSGIATVTDRLGNYIPTGAPARIEGIEQPAVIGFDGTLYVEEPPLGARVTIEQANGLCAFRLPSVIPSGVQYRLGTFVCEALQ